MGLTASTCISILPLTISFHLHLVNRTQRQEKEGEPWDFSPPNTLILYRFLTTVASTQWCQLCWSVPPLWFCILMGNPSSYAPITWSLSSVSPVPQDIVCPCCCLDDLPNSILAPFTLWNYLTWVLFLEWSIIDIVRYPYIFPISIFS